jgi:hypothetical protein
MGAQSTKAQCGRRALSVRDGHKVCLKHSRDEHVYFVTTSVNPFEHIVELIAELTAKNPIFETTLRTALEEKRK